MSRKPIGELRRGWTTGACATAATKAALYGLWRGNVPARVSITLPRGEVPAFDIHNYGVSGSAVWASVIKDAGDDPDVTHGAEIIAAVREFEGAPGTLRFAAGDGIGTVTKAGLPIAVGEAAINPVPRKMMDEVVAELAAEFGRSEAVEIEISVPGGAALAQKTWNPRLGIKGGISILGTTGIVRPFSCAAWIASIHRGVDVARADGLRHVVGATGATSEVVAQAHFGLPDHAMLDMGDFAGGLLKYLARHPVERLTIAGGFGKLTKLAQGALDLHSGRSQVDFEALAEVAAEVGADAVRVRQANSALEAVGVAPGLAAPIAEAARNVAAGLVPDVQVDVLVVSRDGQILGQAS